VFIFLSLFTIINFHCASADLMLSDGSEELGRYTIEGKVYSPEIYMSDTDWQKNVVVSINGGEYQGFLKEDGSFILSSIPVGSYVVDIINSDYVYESVSAIQVTTS
jgi:ER membrane protein complex subunit 7